MHNAARLLLLLLLHTKHSCGFDQLIEQPDRDARNFAARVQALSVSCPQISLLRAELLLLVGGLKVGWILNKHTEIAAPSVYANNHIRRL